MSNGKIIVISGASGVGKSTILTEVMKQRQDLVFSVSATTRLHHKVDVAYEMLTSDKTFVVPQYVKDAIEWLRK